MPIIPKVHALNTMVVHDTRTMCGRSQDSPSHLTIVGEKNRQLITCRRCEAKVKGRILDRDRDRDPKTGRVRKYSAEEWKKKEARRLALSLKRSNNQGRDSRRRRYFSRKGRSDRELIRLVRSTWALTAQQLHVVLGGLEAGRSLSYTRKCCQPSGVTMPPPLYMSRARDLMSDEPSQEVLNLVGDARDEYPDERGEHTRGGKKQCKRSLKTIDLHGDDAAPEVQCPGCRRFIQPLKITKDGRVFLPYHHRKKPVVVMPKVPDSMRVRVRVEPPETDQGSPDEQAPGDVSPE